MARAPRDGNAKGQQYKLSIREKKFVALYLEYGDGAKAVKEAKFNTTAPKQYAKKLLAKPKIQEELARQFDLFQNECIAGSSEIMSFYTKVMRGEVKDQFGLEATLSDRLKATDALAKRQIDAVALAERGRDNAFTINLNWSRENSVDNPNLLPPQEDQTSYKDEILDEDEILYGDADVNE